MAVKIPALEDYGMKEEDIKEEYLISKNKYAQMWIHDDSLAIRVRSSYKEGYKPYYYYKPRYNSDTQYLEYVGNVDTEKYVLSMYVVRDYQIEENTESDV